MIWGRCGGENTQRGDKLRDVHGIKLTKVLKILLLPAYHIIRIFEFVSLAAEWAVLRADWTLD